jgi:hypothetical protein
MKPQTNAVASAPIEALAIGYVPTGTFQWTSHERKDGPSHKWVFERKAFLEWIDSNAKLDAVLEGICRTFAYRSDWNLGNEPKAQTIDLEKLIAGLTSYFPKPDAECMKSAKAQLERIESEDSPDTWELAEETIKSRWGWELESRDLEGLYTHFIRRKEFLATQDL